MLSTALRIAAAELDFYPDFPTLGETKEKALEILNQVASDIVRPLAEARTAFLAIDSPRVNKVSHAEMQERMYPTQRRAQPLDRDTASSFAKAENEMQAAFSERYWKNA